MPRGPKIKGKARQRALTYDQRWDLLIGWARPPGTPGASFASMDDARSAYFEHRDELVTNVGSRPSGYWWFEADGVDRNYRDGLAWLIEHNALRPDEVRQLAEWDEKKTGGNDGRSSDS